MSIWIRLAPDTPIRLDPAERRLPARMPLHAITSVHGEAGLWESLTRQKPAEVDQAADGLAVNLLRMFGLPASEATTVAARRLPTPADPPQLTPG